MSKRTPYVEKERRLGISVINYFFFFALEYGELAFVWKLERSLLLHRIYTLGAVDFPRSWGIRSVTFVCTLVIALCFRFWRLFPPCE